VRKTALVIAMLAAALVARSAWAPPAQTPTLAQIVGQKLVVSMEGTTPSSSLLARARRGQIGGVIVHGFNFSTGAQLEAIAWKLQEAAAAGKQPRLLIGVDQEGGSVKTVRWIPPTLVPSRMHTTATAFDQGRRTAAGLLGLGVNADFAPVADVPASKASEVYRQGRTWSFDAPTTSQLAGAFAQGLAAGRVVATTKHFPGLGYALRNTDRALVRIAVPASRLAPGLLPYRRAIRANVPLIMLSNAIYAAYDPQNAAGWSRAISTGLLRGELGFRGATITDSLDGAAGVRGIPPNGLAIGAANAGTDLILLTGGEASSGRVYAALLRAVRSGRIGRAGLQRSYARILALKSRLTLDAER
jgi:beta-N-acetylhexosaminidase